MIEGRMLSELGYIAAVPGNGGVCGFDDKLGFTSTSPKPTTDVVMRVQESWRSCQHFRGVCHNLSAEGRLEATARDVFGCPGADSSHDGSSDKVEDLRTKNLAIQKRYRDKAKQKRLSTSISVETLAEQLREAEEQKQNLQAVVDKLRTRCHQTVPDIATATFSSIFPDLQSASMDFVPSLSWAGFHPLGRTGVVLRAICSPAKKLSHDYLMSIDGNTYGQILRESTLRLGQLMMHNPEQDLDGPAALKVQEIVNERRGLMIYIACWRPMLHAAKIGKPLVDDDILQPAQAASFYDNLLRAVGLTDNQKLLTEGLFHRWIERYGIFRQQIHANIRHLLDVPPPVENWASEKQGIYDMIYDQRLRALRMALDQSVIACAMFAAEMYYSPNGMTHLQEAKLYVHAHPMLPDIKMLGAKLVESPDSSSKSPPDQKVEVSPLHHKFAMTEHASREEEFPGKMVEAFCCEAELLPNIHGLQVSEAFARVSATC